MTQLAVRTVEIPGGTIEVHEAGSGTPLLFLHGALAGWQVWEPVVAPLAERGYRVVLPTLPLGAHRYPMAPGTDLTPPGLARIIVDLIDALGVERPTLVSTDTATALAQIVLTKHPGAAGGAVLTSGDCFRYFFPPRFRQLQGLGYAPGLLKTVGKMTRNERTRNGSMGFGLLTRAGITQAAAVDWTEPLISNKAVRRDAAAVLRGVNTRHTMAAAKALPMLDVPVMLVWAEDDKAFPMKLARRLAALIPDCRLETVPDARTFVALDAPDVLVSLIEDFVPRHAASERGR
ncbi:MAG TPA: alpha/beta hydrolase [Mycobacteriales bacterium]|jgi:pimeloyl-ACP methyl ester carboxylesterase|nr:alpha/beta hydrolase [Mycobacteriales bacterium]